MVMMVMEALEKAQNIVEELVKYRDEYINNYGLDKAIQKDTDVEKKIKETLIDLDQLQLSIDDKAIFFYLRGKALNISSKHDMHAEECLSKAVKLDPSLIEGWNELGESYWKHKNIEAACNCFTGAISKKKNKVSLRNLSMVQRQLGTDFESKVSNIKKSVDTAKEGVSLDVTDGRSWFVLGNAYLSLFFFTGQNPSSLKSCMAAYKKAASNVIEQSNPDLHYNRAVAFKYEENFPDALTGYEMAGLLDPSWNEPKIDRQDLINRLKNTMEMIEKKGNLKPKKVALYMNQLKDSDYGPYTSGTYTSPLNREVTLKKVALNELKPGSNNNTVISGKVVAVIPVKDSVPFPCIVMDNTGYCMAISVFNLAVGKGMITGDSIAIPEPYVQQVNVQVNNEQIVFNSIRVNNPVVMVVNKRKVASDRLSFSVLSVTNKSQ